MAFDVKSILNTVHNDAGSTEFIPIPEGEYRAVSIEVTGKHNIGKGGKDDSYVIELKWEIDAGQHPQVADITKRASNSAKQSFFVEFTADGRGLDMSEGRNVQLNRAREVLGQNVPGRAWKPADMVGKAAIVNVKHRLVENEPFAEVRSIRPIA